MVVYGLNLLQRLREGQADTQTAVETDAKEERRSRRMGETLQLQEEGDQSII